GSFLIGLIQEIGTASLLIPDTTRLFLTVGIMGGLTTYSSFSYETIRLAQMGAWGQEWDNVLVTTALGLVVCFLGLRAGQVVVVVDTAEHREAVLPEVDRLMKGGLITMEKVRVLRYAPDEKG